MKMDFNELKTTITENESKKILDMFSILLREQSEYLKDTRAKSVKETISQACFISLGLCGEADGIFFPNAQFKFKNTKMKFCCLCIHNNKPAICYKYETIGGYFFKTLEGLIYSNEEIETKRNLSLQIAVITDNLKLLNSIQQVKKSDGSTYQNLCKNFISSLDNFKMTIDNDIMQISAIEQSNNSSIYYSDRIYITDFHNVNEKLTPADIMEMIKEYINIYIEQKNLIETKLKRLHKEAREIEKLFDELLAKQDNMINKDFFREYIKANLYKL